MSRFLSGLCCVPSRSSAPRVPLQEPKAQALASAPLDKTFPFAKYPGLHVFAKAHDPTPLIVRCGMVGYRASWKMQGLGAPRIDFEDTTSLAYNRALFIAHSRKLLTRGGMQASRPQLYAAAALYGVHLRIWGRDTRGQKPWRVCENIAPGAGAAAETVDLCLYMAAGDASHYRVLTGVAPQSLADGDIITRQGCVVEAGAEGECMYLALAWALDRPQVRQIRLDFDALRAAGKAPTSYVGYFKSRSHMLTMMHAEIAQALAAPEHAERIDAEVQDAIEMQQRRRARQGA